MSSSYIDFDKLNILCEMGYPENRAKRALLLTRSVSIDGAITWLSEHENDDDVDQPLTDQDYEQDSYAVGVASSSTGTCPVVGVPSIGGGSLPVVIHPNGEESTALVIGVSGECKVVLVVPRELELSPGKLGSQCAHAALGIYRLMIANQVPWMAAWESQGEKVVVLGVEDCGALDGLLNHAMSKTLLTYMVEDAGQTEVEPGTVTMLAVGGIAEVVDEVTGHLRAY